MADVQLVGQFYYRKVKDQYSSCNEYNDAVHSSTNALCCFATFSDAQNLYARLTKNTLSMSCLV